MSFHKRLIRAATRRVKSSLRPIVRRLGSPGPGIPPSYWDLSHDPENGLCLQGLELHSLCEKWGSPLHVVDASMLRRNVERFQSILPGSDLQCEVYSSYKTNPVPGVLQQLHDCGVGAEVISPYELWLAFQLGVPPQKIVYNGPAKSDESIREAVDREILLLNVNHREEIGRVARIAAAAGKRPSIGIRVAVPGGWEGQFGVPVSGGRALDAYREALQEESLNVVGLHAHFGVAIRTAEQVSAFVRSVLAFCDELHDVLGVELSLLDFGGSLAIPSVAPLSESDRRLNWRFHRPLPAPDVTAALSIESYTRHLLGEVKAHFEARGRRTPRVLIEPGRALTGSAGMLLTRVITTKEADDGVHFAVLDAGINLAEGVRSEYHQLFPVNRHTEPASRPYTLAGPICSPADVLYLAWDLPELSPGDSLAIMDAGAYFVPFSTSFSFPRPAIIMVDEGRDSLMRRAETFDDLIGHDVEASYARVHHLDVREHRVASNV